MKKVHNPDIIRLAQETIDQEVKALLLLSKVIGESFVEAVLLATRCKGRILVTGVGKSAIIGRKMVATFNSINVPAVFLHAADALHGDLGSLQKEDIVFCLSKSGDTQEIKALIPLIKAKENPLIAIVSKEESYLAKMADVVILTPVEKEADPLDLAPTVSTIVQLAIGDALAVCLMSLKDFRSDEFAELHPGGMLGKKLHMRVRDLAHLGDIPVVHLTDPIEKVIVEISSKRLGATAVLDEAQRLQGIITDGDLRRMLQREGDFRKNTARDVMSQSPRMIHVDAKATEALDRMKQNNITQLLVVGDGQKYLGVIHIHDLLREGF